MPAPFPAHAPVRVRIAPVRVRTSAGRGWAAAGFEPAALAALIAADDCPDPAAEVMKRGNTALVLRSANGWGGVERAICWKRIRRKTWLKRLATVVRTRRTVECFDAANRLLAAGVATPAALACTAPPAWAIDRPGWLVTDWIEGTEDLAVARRRLCALPPAVAHRAAARYAAAVGGLLGKLHAAGASHRDLKPNNLLVALAPGRTPAAWVIDLDAVTFPRRLTAGRRRRDLRRLFRDQPGLPRTVRARFLRAYAEASGQERWREAWPRFA